MIIKIKRVPKPAFTIKDITCNAKDSNVRVSSKYAKMVRVINPIKMEVKCVESAVRLWKSVPIKRGRKARGAAYGCSK